MEVKMRFLFVVNNMRDGDLYYTFPLGIAYLATALEEEGVDVEILDLDVVSNTEEVVFNTILAEFDCVGIGFISARFPLIKNLLSTIRKACDITKTIMVLGGHGASATPEFMLKETGADFVICGEGEQAIKYLVRKLKTGDPVERVIERPYIKNLDYIPFPSWHLFDMDTYSTSRERFYKGAGKLGFISSSRGCVGNCSFCYRMYKGYRFRTVDNILAEIEFLHCEYGIDSIFFYDEMAFSTTKRIHELLDGFERLSFNIKWNTSTRVEVLQNIDDVKRMKESGCMNIGVGVESMDVAVLKAISKRITPRQNRIAIENCSKVALDTSINVLWNMPNDTIESLWKNVEFVLEYSSWNECRTIKPITPYPGCLLYYKAIEDGKLKGPGDFYDKLVNLDRITVNFTELSEEVMYEELYKANSALIDAYTKNSGKGEAEEMKKAFYDLYFNFDVEFRGVR
jgi:radical SAM superfamily enzyme YgiQ (UPF0313 family)